jgi:hypothetical protein
MNWKVGDWFRSKYNNNCWFQITRIDGSIYYRGMDKITKQFYREVRLTIPNNGSLYKLTKQEKAEIL